MTRLFSRSPQYVEKNLSLSKLSKVLREGRDDLFVDYIEKDALKSRLGKLDNGQELGWWLNHKPETKRLTDVLELNHVEFVRRLSASGYVVDFAAFPYLPPLDLSREPYCAIAEEILIDVSDDQTNRTSHTLNFWLTSHGYNAQPGTVEWLHVPDQLEFQLLSTRLHATSRHRVLQSHSLDEIVKDKVGELRHESDLVICVETVPSVSGLARVLDYHVHSSLLVISRVPPSFIRSDKEISPGAERKGDQEPSVLSDSGPLSAAGLTATEGASNPTRMRLWGWRRLPSWRELLVDWIWARLPKDSQQPRFDRDKVKMLLYDVDANHRWFSTTNDVLRVCRMAQDGLLETFVNVLGGDENTSELARLFHITKPNLVTLKALVIARWQSSEFPWDDGLTREEWERIVIKICPFYDLVSAELVSKSGDKYGFSQPANVELLLRIYLRKQICEKTVDAWAFGCFDDSRRAAIDSALDSLDAADVTTLAEKIVADFSNPLIIGPAEAFFVAASRRVALGKPIEKVSASVEVNKLLLRRLNLNDEPVRPWSRPVETPAQRIEWIGACWVCSLELNKPEEYADVAPTWMFPGWGGPLPERLPEWLHPRASFSNIDHWVSQTSPWRNFLSIVEQWVKELDEPPIAGGAPNFLIPALFFKCASDGWAPEVSWWGVLLTADWVQYTLLVRLEHQSKAFQCRAALRLWPSLVKFQSSRISLQHGRWPVGQKFATFDQDSPYYSPVVRWLLTTLASKRELEDEAFTSIGKEEHKFLKNNPEWLPATFKRRLLKFVLDGLAEDGYPMFIPGYFSKFGQDSVAALDDFLRDRRFGSEAASAIWAWNPQQAIRKLSAQDSKGRDGRRHLINWAPINSTAIALEALHGDPTILGVEELRRWVQFRLPNAGPFAKKLLELVYFQLGGQDCGGKADV